MYDLFMFGAYSAILFVCGFAAFVLGFLFTERFKPLFKFKPFNCRPCLTFWLTILLAALPTFAVAYYSDINLNTFSRLLVVAVIFLSGLVNYFIARGGIKIVR